MYMFVDLHLENAGLKEEEERLGFTLVRTPKKIFLKNSNDLKLLDDYCIVEGEDTELLRKAAKKRVLINAFYMKNFFKDDGLVRAVAEGNAIFEVPLGIVLNSEGIRRANALRHFALFLKKCVKMGASYCITSRAKTVYDLKTPFEMSVIGLVLGLTREQAKAAISLYPEKWLE